MISLHNFAKCAHTLVRNSVSFATLTEAQKKLMAKSLPKQIAIPGVQHVILISSAKGGVGKSSVTVNLAFALKNLDKNKSVGILDADVFGPSIPRMLNIDAKPEVDDHNLIKPLVNYGIHCMSMGFLIEQKAALVWRGLMVMQAIQKLLRQVAWPAPLDYLLIDMPPGTGDVQLSVVQNVPISGVIIVTTPQRVALEDARKSILMYRAVNCQVLGLVQNMHGFACTSCGHENFIFGKKGAQQLSKEFDVPLLADIPIDEHIQRCCDEGTPLHLSDAHPRTIQCYSQLATKLVQLLPEKKSV